MSTAPGPDRRPALATLLPGRPRGQGSMRLIRAKAGHEVASYPREVVDYRNQLVDALRRDWADRPALTGPVEVDVVIAYPRPGAHYLPANRRRPEPELRPDAPTWHTGTPDADKVARLVDDALVAAGVLVDDRQVAALSVLDQWAGTGLLGVTVWELW